MCRINDVLRYLIGCAMMAACFQPGLRAQQSQSNAELTDQARALADDGVLKARAGKTDEALSLFRQAIKLTPHDVPILRDYAVVLGWGEHYKEAIAVIQEVVSLEDEQPDWALREFARSYLFGGDTKTALQILNKLVARGDTSEPVLLRRALALRWQGQPRAAQTAYEAARNLYPRSGAARAGIVYCLGAQEKLSEALRAAEAGLRELPNDPDLLKAKIRILNWMGRHLEAQRVLQMIPGSLADDREVLEDRISAARWGGDPVTAASTAKRLDSVFPDNRDTKSLVKQLRFEYGGAFTPQFRYVSDSDGLIDKTWSGEFSVHLSPAHELRAGYVYRELLQTESLFWRRYDLGWTGVLGRHVRSYATLSDVNYASSATHKIIGDAGLSFPLTDSVKFTAGGGTIAMDAFRAAQNLVTAPFAFGELALSPNPLTQVQARYARYDFSDGVKRDRADFEVGRRIHSQAAFKFRLGWRSSLIWHDRYTPDFYSPSSFQSHMAVAQGYGRLARALDYSVEVAGGWQMEPDTPREHPVQVSGRLVWRPTESLRTIIEVGRTTSSLERVTADRTPYTRRFASIGVVYSFY